MPETTDTIGKQISFAELFREFTLVQIPIIQRDYAQGRSGQEELRHDFLSALKAALDKEDDNPKHPLDLDFVYGSGFGSNGATKYEGFAPLDGQQRLTTLFLLHWYLAWKDGKADDFQRRFLNDQRSRFSYEVRPSSHDFFNRLAVNFPEETAASVSSLSSLIQDKSWFFRSWTHDPTIQSALTMLDEIHNVFVESNDYYQRLIDFDHPRITFQLLELKNFGLSDDLYIKMNARGKPLTAFEAFKARLEQHLDESLRHETRSLHGRDVTIREYFSHRMDTAWADVFWAQRNRYTNLYDQEFMRLIKAVALVSLNLDDDAADRIVSELRALPVNISFARFFDLGCLNKRMLETFEGLLDYWSEKGLNAGTGKSLTALASRAAFDAATSHELTYPELVKFAAFSAFVRIHGLSLKLELCDSWLRVISNLVENSDIERPADFIDALKSLRHLEARADRILNYFAEGSEVSAFNRQQVREERIKAALMLEREAWKELIFSAESHGYFNGQIEFLLKFSGILDYWLAHELFTPSNEEHTHAQNLFSDYLEKANAVFDANGLRLFVDNRLERALLTLGDYTLSHGRNRSLLQNKVGSGERRPTWKLLLRGHMTDSVHEGKRLLVKALFDSIDLQGGIDASLDNVMHTVSIEEPWRRMMVEDPKMIAYCGQKMFRLLYDGSVYLISKLRTTSDHVELWSYYLYHTTLVPMRDGGRLSPFTVSYISVNNEDYVPFISLSWEKGNVFIRIDFGDGKYRIVLTCNEIEAQQFWSERVEQSFEVERRNGEILFTASDQQVQAIIAKIVIMARGYADRKQEIDS